MGKIILLFSLSLFLGAATVWAGQPLKDVDLDQFLWKNRVVLLFSPSHQHAAYKTLLRELDQEGEGVRDRDLVVLRLLEQGPSFLGTQEMTPQAAEDLRRRFGVSREAFTVVLVGKDGGVKLRQAGPTALRDIFELIDGMPMRRREMQGK